MSFFNPYAIGFVCVAGSAVVGADYIVQSKAAGSVPGEYAFSSYLDSYGLRVDDTVAFIDKTRRQSVEPRTHLPQEPIGWERTEWDIAAIDVDALTEGMHLVDKMAVKDEMRKALRVANYEAWEYRKGDQVVRMSARFEEEPEGMAGPLAGLLTDDFKIFKEPAYRLFDVVENVPFLEVTDAKARGPETRTLLEAHLGDQIVVAVAGEVQPEDLRALLEQIDLTELNLMLSDPLTFVGQDASEIDAEQLEKMAVFQAGMLTGGSLVTGDMMAAVLAGEPFETAQTIVKEETPAAAPVRRLDQPKATRLQLSGGRTCLGSDSRLCN